jgi:hypothetical protein
MEKHTKESIYTTVYGHVNKFKKDMSKESYPGLGKLVDNILEISYRKGFIDGHDSQSKKITEIKEELQKVLLQGRKEGSNIDPEKVYKKGHYAGD